MTGYWDLTWILIQELTCWVIWWLQRVIADQERKHYLCTKCAGDKTITSVHRHTYLTEQHQDACKQNSCAKVSGPGGKEESTFIAKSSCETRQAVTLAGHMVARPNAMDTVRTGLTATVPIESRRTDWNGKLTGHITWTQCIWQKQTTLPSLLPLSVKSNNMGVIGTQNLTQRHMRRY